MTDQGFNIGLNTGATTRVMTGKGQNNRAI